MGCRRTDEQPVMVRIVTTADGPAVSRTAPGRGAWLHPGCGRTALRRRSIPRALRAPVDAVALAALVEAVDADAVDLVKRHPHP